MVGNKIEIVLLLLLCQNIIFSICDQSVDLLISQMKLEWKEDLERLEERLKDADKLHCNTMYTVLESKLNSEHSINTEKFRLIENKLETDVAKIGDNQAEIQQKVQDVETKVYHNEVNNDQTIQDIEAEIAQITRNQAQTQGLVQNVNNKQATNANKIRALETSTKTIRNPVIFSTVRTRNNVGKNHFITYNSNVANIGGGMNYRSGIFTVPVSGLYSFSVSLTTSPGNHLTFIHVYKNDRYKFRLTDHSTRGTHDNFSYNWMMDLSRGDRIRLKAWDNELWVGEGEYVWFNGQLLKAD